MVRSDDHINSATITTPYTGTINATGARVTIVVAAAMPPRSAAMLMMFATTSSVQALQSTHGA
jgi:hypothetical protein